MTGLRSSREPSDTIAGRHAGAVAPVFMVEQRPRRLRAALVTVVALAALWLIVRGTLAAYLATTSPELALRLAPDNAEALLNLADRKLAALASARQAQHKAKDASGAGAESTGRGSFANPALGRIFAKRLDANGDSAQPPAAQPEALASGDSQATAAELAEINSLAETALAAAPMSARALSIMGQVAAEAGDAQRAEALMSEAVGLSRHDATALNAMFLYRLAAKDYEGAIRHADALLRTRPSLHELVVPLLTRMIESGEGSAVLVKHLAARPVWRGLFLDTMVLSITDARTPLSLMIALKDTQAPPDDREVAHYERFLISKNLHELAYYTWLQFLPPERLAGARLVYNGDFSAAPSGNPFDWTIAAGTGVNVEIAARPDAGENGLNPALRIEFGTGRVQMGKVTQILMLAPGPQVLRYTYRGEVTARRGLKWVIACTQGTMPPLAESPMFIGQQRSWRTLEVPFTVPDQGCRSQVLQLVHDARSASEEFVSGVMWYDDVEVVRAQETPQSR